MMKLFFVGRRAAGRTRSAAQRHLARVHGRMVVLPPADAAPMPLGYTQHHVLDGGYPAVPGPHAVERDLVTEFWFNDVDHLRGSTRTDYYLNVLAPDEPRFVDRATVEKLRVTPRMLRDGEQGGYKLMLLVNRRPADAWDAAIERTASTLADAGFGAMLLNDTAESPIGPPLVDVVIEAWHRNREVAISVANSLSGLPIAEHANLDRSLALAAEVFTSERLRRLAADA